MAFTVERIVIKEKNSQIGELEKENAALKKKISVVESKNIELNVNLVDKDKHRCFGTENFRNDDVLIRFYTGCSIVLKVKHENPRKPKCQAW